MKWKIIGGVVLAVIAIIAALELFVITVAVALIAGIIFIFAVAAAVTIKVKNGSDENTTASEPNNPKDM